jgi:transposase InsO family protein
MRFENCRLAMYPRPIRVIHDQGHEFSAPPFQAALIRNGIQPVSITIKNPQANYVCELFHGTIKNQLRTIFQSNPPQDNGNALNIINSAIASAVSASRVAVHQTLGVSPGGLAFQGDMLHPIPILADFDLIRQCRQKLIDSDAPPPNLRRTYPDYKVGDEVLVKVFNPAGLEERAVGPFTVEQIHTNGTLTIQRVPNVYEQINI